MAAQSGNQTSRRGRPASSRAKGRARTHASRSRAANARPGFRVVQPSSEWQRMVRVGEDGKPVERAGPRRFGLFERTR